MNFIGVCLILGAVGTCGYLAYTLVRDIITKIKDKKNKGGEP